MLTVVRQKMLQNISLKAYPKQQRKILPSLYQKTFQELQYKMLLIILLVILPIILVKI